MSDTARTARSLLEQHEVLRALTVDMVHVARTLTIDGTGMVAALLYRLAGELAAHNRLEEQLLAPLVLASEPGASLRLVEMLEDHRREHEALVSDLLALATVSEASIDHEARIFEVAAAIYRHMEREEIEYLNARIVGDELLG